VTTLALIEVAVSVQVVLLEVYTQLEPDIALLTAERPLLSATHNTVDWIITIIKTTSVSVSDGDGDGAGRWKESRSELETVTK